MYTVKRYLLSSKRVDPREWNMYIVFTDGESYLYLCECVIISSYIIMLISFHCSCLTVCNYICVNNIMYKSYQLFRILMAPYLKLKDVMIIVKIYTWARHLSLHRFYLGSFYNPLSMNSKHSTPLYGQWMIGHYIGSWCTSAMVWSSQLYPSSSSLLRAFCSYPFYNNVH